MADAISYDISPRRALKQMDLILRSGLVPFLRGSPGVGKSSLVNAMAHRWGLAVIDHRLSTSQPEDLTGLPRFNANDRAEMVPFSDLFPLEGDELPAGKSGWIVFLDEFPSASREVMAASYKLVLDRMVGQKRLHKNVVLVLAGNKDTDRAIVNNMGTAMQSRIVTLDLEVSFEGWLEDVAIPQNYSAEVISYLSQFNGKLMTFNPAHKEKNFGCPRTWEFANKMVKTLKVMKAPVNGEYLPSFVGCLGESLGSEFTSYCAVMDKLPKIADIISNPNAAPVPMAASERWATVTVVSEHLSKDNLEALITYVKRLDKSFQILFLRMLNIRHPKLHGEQAYIQLCTQLSGDLYGR